MLNVTTGVNVFVRSQSGRQRAQEGEEGAGGRAATQLLAFGLEAAKTFAAPLYFGVRRCGLTLFIMKHIAIYVGRFLHVLFNFIYMFQILCDARRDLDVAGAPGSVRRN